MRWFRTPTDRETEVENGVEVADDDDELSVGSEGTALTFFDSEIELSMYSDYEDDASIESQESADESIAASVVTSDRARSERAEQKRQATKTKKMARAAAKAEKKKRYLEKKKQNAETRSLKGHKKAKKLTYMQSLAARAKSKIADKMVERYDAYAEKQRLYVVEDPAIPTWVKTPARKVWGALAPHFRNEFLAIVETEIGLRTKRNASVEHRWKSFSLDSLTSLSCRQYVETFRAKVLYALYPYDRTIWTQIQCPIWWVVFIIRCIPVFGVSSFAFTALLCIIDRRDQFQLIQFILIFKKFQFLISGVCGLLYFSAWYSHCVLLEQPTRTNSCGDDGPGTFRLGIFSPSVVMYPIIIGFFAQIALVWVALYLMRFSVPKGGSVRHGARLVNDFIQWEERDNRVVVDPESLDPEYLETKEEDKPTPKFVQKRKIVKRIGKVVYFDRKTGLHNIELRHERLTVNKTATVDPSSSRFETTTVDLNAVRYFVIDEQGPLQNLLYYDLFCFFFVCVIALLLLGMSESHGDLNHGWQVRAVLLGMQIGYSLCAFPFAFASLSPWKWVFTHARDTGYNEMGVCVTKLGALNFYWVKDAVVATKPKDDEDGEVRFSKRNKSNGKRLTWEGIKGELNGKRLTWRGVKGENNRVDGVDVGNDNCSKNDAKTPPLGDGAAETRTQTSGPSPQASNVRSSTSQLKLDNNPGGILSRIKKNRPSIRPMTPLVDLNLESTPETTLSTNGPEIALAELSQPPPTAVTATKSPRTPTLRRVSWPSASPKEKPGRVIRRISPAPGSKDDKPLGTPLGTEMV